MTSRLRTNARQWNAIGSLFGMWAHILRAQQRADLEAEKLKKLQSDQYIQQQRAALISNQLVLSDLKIIEQKHRLESLGLLGRQFRVIGPELEGAHRD